MDRLASFLLLSGLLAVAVPLFAQQNQGEQAADEVPRTLVIYFDPSALNVSADAKVLLYESLVQQVRHVAPEANIVEPAHTEPAATGSVLLKGQFPPVPKGTALKDRFTRSSRADSWLSVMLSGKQSSVTVTYEFRDLLFPGRSSSGSFSTTIDSRFRNLSGPFWSRIVDMLQDRLKPRIVQADITFVGPNGTRIQDEANRARATTIRGGKGVIPVPAPGEYRFVATCAGYYSAAIPASITQTGKTVTVQMKRKSRFSFDFTLSDLSFPAVRLSFQIFPEWLFARAGLQTYLVGFVPLSSGGTGQSTLFASYGVSSVSLGVGSYLSGQTGLWGTFRFYAAVEGFLRIDTTSQFIGIDPVLPYGGQLELGTEILPQSRIRGLFALLSRLYVTSDPALAAASAGTDRKPWNVHFFGNYVLEFPTMYIGVRFQP